MTYNVFGGTLNLAQFNSVSQGRCTDAYWYYQHLVNKDENILSNRLAAGRPSPKTMSSGT